MTTDKKELIKLYTASNLKVIGLETEFKLCHIPFLVYKDVYGVMCLVGSSGTGKTTMVKRIGKLNEKATGGKVGVFSADKARYEDFIGCPIPDEDSNEMKIYPMPNSVSQMETLLIDEINRASYENQEKWLSLCATKEIDGLPTKCKYIYAAMNPLVSEGSDVYEGVQPLDKALGERVMGLIDIPSLNKLKTVDRKAIIMSAFNQVDWVPTDELVEAHTAYVEEARQIYESLKQSHMAAIADYIDAIQTDLKKETKSQVTVEARRAQFMLTNILATRALDLISGIDNIEMSALNALQSSFPNALWEQPINREALRTAHTRASALLKVSQTDRKRSAANYEGIERPLEEIKKLMEDKSKKFTREYVSKVIMQGIPLEAEDPINYYTYACAVYHSLTINVSPGTPQTLMKEQEFSRLKKIYEKITAQPAYTKFSTLAEGMRKNNNTLELLPENYPVYIKQDPEPKAEYLFKQTLTIAPGIIAHTLASMPNIEVTCAGEIVMIVDKFTTILKVVKELQEFIKDYSVYEDVKN